MAYGSKKNHSPYSARLKQVAGGGIDLRVDLLGKPR